MRTAPAAIKAALAAKTNVPGTCQAFTHRLYDPTGALAVGDFDGDKAADAEDGWKSEPDWAKHTDRRPAIGAPGAWLGGSNDHGHRAICMSYTADGEALFRSTDGNGSGHMGNHTISWFEREWGLRWAGWSETISGRKIEGLVPAPGSKPAKPSTPAPAKKTRGEVVDKMLALSKEASAPAGSKREKHLKAAIAELKAIPYL